MLPGLKSYSAALIDNERCVSKLYCDSRGWPTIGVGFLVKTAADAVALPLKHDADESLATDAEKERAFVTVMDAFRPNYRESYYTKMTDLHLTRDDITQILENRLEHEFVPGLRKLFPAFDSYPEAARTALVDIAWNRGVGGLHKLNGGKLCVAVLNVDSMDNKEWRAMRWEHVAEASWREGGTDARNVWTATQFRKAAKAELV
jgi:hypothetical protein